MNESVIHDQQVNGACAVEPVWSAPVLLRQAREAAGLHIAALAAALKVPVKKLEALEGGRSDELLDATFARALAASVCRQLKIDPTEVLALLPLAGGSRLGEDQALNTPFRPTRELAAASRAPQGVPKAAWIAMGILLAAAVVWWAVPPVNDTTPQAAMPAPPPMPLICRHVIFSSHHVLLHPVC